MKIIVIVVFSLIMLSLAKALFHVVKHKADVDSEKTMVALTIRSSLSVILFVVLLIAVVAKVVKPHGVEGNFTRSSGGANQTVKNKE